MARTQVHLPTQVRGPLPISMGGTGTTTGGGGGDGGLPDPTGHAGEFLVTNGATFAWAPFPASLDGGVFDPGGTSGSFYSFDGGVY